MAAPQETNRQIDLPETADRPSWGWFIRRPIRPFPNEEWYLSLQDSRQAFLRLFNEAKDAIYIVCAAVPDFWESREVVTTFSRLLRKPTQISVAFSKGSTLEEARTIIRKEHKSWERFQSEYPGQFHLHWAKEPPAQHFVSIDSRSVLLEQPNHPPGGLNWVLIRHDLSFARYWEREFQKYVSNNTELLGNHAD